ncbi:MAG TPA: OmpA family protein [Kofleriaceae bacterium]
MSQRPPIPRQDSGVPIKQRRFPWRLWLFAILMAGAAGAGGYFTWQYRSQSVSAKEDLTTCSKNLGQLQSSAGDGAKQLKTCTDSLGASTLKATELEKQNNEFSKNLNASKDELTALRAQKAEADKRMAAIEDIRKQFAKMIDTGQLRVTARRGQLVLSLPSEVLFPTGSAELSKQGEYAVVEVGAVLKKFPDRRFLVVGHTDNQDFVKPKNEPTTPVCVPTDNWQLSTARALTVTRVLVTAGMDAKNLVPAGVGANDPIASNATSEGRQKNRRIEVSLLPALNELPPLPSNLTEEGAPAKK